MTQLSVARCADVSVQLLVKKMPPPGRFDNFGEGRTSRQ
jgi:hypothetical protein